MRNLRIWHDYTEATEWSPINRPLHISLSLLRLPSRALPCTLLQLSSRSGRKNIATDSNLITIDSNKSFGVVDVGQK
jgi:hypothetical protein